MTGKEHLRTLIGEYGGNTDLLYQNLCETFGVPDDRVPSVEPLEEPVNADPAPPRHREGDVGPLDVGGYLALLIIN